MIIVGIGGSGFSGSGGGGVCFTKDWNVGTARSKPFREVEDGVSSIAGGRRNRGFGLCIVVLAMCILTTAGSGCMNILLFRTQRRR